MVASFHLAWFCLIFEGDWRRLCGGNVSRMTPLELWIPLCCIESRESDWFGHITWRGDEEDQGVYPREV